MFTNPAHIIERSGISAGMRVGDFGTGAGAYIPSLLKAVGNEGAVYAIDIQQALVDRLESEVRLSGSSNIMTLCGDLECSYGARISDGLLDYVLASNILFQLEKKGAFYKEAWRALRPGGRFLVVDWLNSFSGIGPDSGHILYMENARAFGELAGFRYQELLWEGDYHYGLIFEKPQSTML